jgi:hypothetical protein
MTIHHLTGSKNGFTCTVQDIASARLAASIDLHHAAWHEVIKKPVQRHAYLGNKLWQHQHIKPTPYRPRQQA